MREKQGKEALGELLVMQQAEIDGDSAASKLGEEGGKKKVKDENNYPFGLFHGLVPIERSRSANDSMSPLRKKRRYVTLKTHQFFARRTPSF